MALPKVFRSGSNRTPSLPSLIDRFFDTDLLDWDAFNFAGDNMTLPAVNLKETKNEYCIEVAAPGLNKEDFKVSYDDGMLTISSEKQQEKEEKEGEKVTRREFSYESFQRSFTVPEDVVNTEKISAKYENGILYVTLPKHEEAKKAKNVKEIKIS
jgi:HSP20 family protein